MAPIRNAATIYAKLPTGEPVLGETLVYDASQTIDLDDSNLVEKGQVLVKTLALSLDPYMRGKMRPAHIQSYSPPFEVGQVLDGSVAGKVVRSEDDRFQVGDFVVGGLPHREYNVVPGDSLRKVNNEAGLSPSVFIGLAGMPGLTAWLGYKEYAKPQAGETLFVNSAAGAVGSTIVQLAKLDGLKVIASAGGDDKVEWLKKELGADVAFNYKTTDTVDILKEHGPIDIFWDHVGGKVVEDVLNNANYYARFILVGAISQYNAEERYGIRNLSLALTKTISINGFIVSYLSKKVGTHDFYTEVPRLIKEGKLKSTEHVVEGLENEGQAFIDLLKGANTGKFILKVADN